MDFLDQYVSVSQVSDLLQINAILYEHITYFAHDKSSCWINIFKIYLTNPAPVNGVLKKHFDLECAQWFYFSKD